MATSAATAAAGVAPASVLADRTLYPHLNDIEWNALGRMAKRTGDTAVELILQNGSEVDQHQAALKWLDGEALALSQQPSSTAARSPFIKLEVSAYGGEGGMPLQRWFVEVETAIRARQISDAEMQVVFMMSRLKGQAKNWAFGRRLADPTCFSTLDELKLELETTFDPPENEMRIRSDLLRIKQGKSSLNDYCQKARYMISCLRTAPLDMATQVTVFLQGMKDGPVKVETFRQRPPTFEDAILVALREEYTLRQAHGGQIPNWLGSQPQVGSGPEPMQVDALAADNRPQQRVGNAQRKKQVTCFRCQKTGHYAKDCRAPMPVTLNVIEGDNTASDPNGDDQ